MLAKHNQRQSQPLETQNAIWADFNSQPIRRHRDALPIIPHLLVV